MIIGLVGLSRAGKDTAATYFTEKGFKRYAFADPLKSVCKELFGFNNDQLYGDGREIVDPRYNVTPRCLLQWLGETMRTDLGKAINQDTSNFWINKMKDVEGDIIVTDVRYPNEGKAIQDRGGYLIYIKRDVPRMDHPSEQYVGMFPTDFTIDNNGTLDDLFKEVKRIYNKINPTHTLL